MSERTVVAGRVRSGTREGQLWVGIQGDDTAYEPLRSGLTGTTTHALVIGDETAVLTLIRVLVETALVEDSTVDLLDGIARMLGEAGEAA